MTALPVGKYVRVNKLDPPVAAKFIHDNVHADVLVLSYIFKEGTIFNEIERPDGTKEEVSNLWLNFSHSDEADVIDKFASEE